MNRTPQGCHRAATGVCLGRHQCQAFCILYFEAFPTQPRIHHESPDQKKPPSFHNHTSNTVYFTLIHNRQYASSKLPTLPPTSTLFPNPPPSLTATPPLQRHQTLPPAQTSSAREALQSFYCQLCQKGYSRMNDYEAHLSSYDHSHKQRLKDMKAMVRDPAATARARRQEQKAEGVISIKLGEAASAGTGGGAGAAAAGGGFKKGGFKKTGFKSAFGPVGGGAAAAAPKEDTAGLGKREGEPKMGLAAPAKSELVESDTEDEGYEVYDPRRPTD